MTTEAEDVDVREPLHARVAAWPWGLLPAAFGLLLLAGAAAVALIPASAPSLALATEALAAATGLGLLVTGALVHRAVEERRYYVATQEGLIEEVSQEFDKVRDSIGSEAARATREATKVARLSSRVERLEAEIGELSERLASVESPLGRTVTLTPTPARSAGESMPPLKAEADAGS